MAVGGSLAACLLQMAQQLDAVPHRSRHWKKQMLQPDSEAPPSHAHNSSGDYECKQASVRKVQRMSSLSAVGGESFTMPSYYESNAAAPQALQRKTRIP